MRPRPSKPPAPLRQARQRCPKAPPAAVADGGDRRDHVVRHDVAAGHAQKRHFKGPDQRRRSLHRQDHDPRLRVAHVTVLSAIGSTPPGRVPLSRRPIRGVTPGASQDRTATLRMPLNQASLGPVVADAAECPAHAGVCVIAPALCGRTDPRGLLPGDGRPVEVGRRSGPRPGAGEPRRGPAGCPDAAAGRPARWPPSRQATGPARAATAPGPALLAAVGWRQVRLCRQRRR
jgi:hypothetical protein